MRLPRAPWTGGRARRGRRAVGAVTAQFSQAFGSLVLQVLAARSLGLPAFGVFALLIGSLVLATGLMTGVVGDSLTVLDRSRPAVRAGLQVWCVLIALGTFVVGVAVAAGTGLVGPGEAVWFGVAMAAYVVEDTVRRLLMATLRFWRVVLVDLTHAVVAVLALVVAVTARGSLTLLDFVVALAAGQVVATVVGVLNVPAAERYLAPWRGAAVGAVGSFGVWRGLQQGIRPATMMIMRILVVVAAGTAAMGALEAARLYMAPALLVVQGAGSFLLSVFAAQRSAPVARAVRQADRAALAMMAATIGLGALAVGALPWLGPLISGASYRLDPVAVAAWAAFACGVAAVVPFASLAAVRGRQASVVALRVVDSALALLAVLALLHLTSLGPSAVPFGLAAGSFVGAVLQRRVARRSGDAGATSRTIGAGQEGSAASTQGVQRAGT